MGEGIRPAGRRAVVGESIVSSISVKPGFAAVPFAGLTEVVSRQRVFAPVVAEYLRRIEYGSDGWPVRLVSPATDRPVMVVDPTRSFGQPIFIHGAARMEDVLDRWRAGDALTEVAADFGVPLEDVEDVLRVSLPAAA